MSTGDNTTQTSNDTLATNNVATLNGAASSGVKVSRSKVGYGDDGTYRDASTAFPLPTNMSSSQGNVPNTSAVIGTTVNSAVTANVSTMGNGTVTIEGGTFTSLPIAFEWSISGNVWYPLEMERGVGEGVITAVTLTAGGGYAWNYKAPGYQQIRVRLTAAMTGTVAPTVTITQGPFLYENSPVVHPLDGNKATYVASVSGMSAAFAGDVFRVSGSATRLVRVTKAEVSCTTGAATNARLQLIKRTTANSGGTTSAATVGAVDSQDSAATATATGYTAVPTPGTSGPTVGNYPAFTSAAGTFGNPWAFGQREKAVLLRGTAEGLAVNMSTAPGTSGSWTITVWWTEENLA